MSEVASAALPPQLQTSQSPQSLQPEVTLALAPLSIVLCLLAACAALSARGILPATWLPLFAGPSLFALGALPLLARWSPSGSDPFKLGTFTLALSPLWMAAVWGAWHLAFDGRDALALTAATAALLHLLGIGVRLGRAPWSRAQCCCTVLALSVAIVVAWMLLRGNEPRLAGSALVRAAVAMSIERSLPPVHPWLSGQPWSQAWSADLAAAFTMGALGVAPSLAHACFAVLAAFLAPLFLFQLAASVWCDSRRSAISVALALCACTLALFSAQARTALGPFLSPGPAPWTLTLSLAALAAAAHALRHGMRPWVELCALLHGLALLVEFQSAWPAALGTLLVTLSPLCESRARPRLLLALACAALPGLIQTRWYAPFLSANALEPTGAQALGAAPWIVLAASGTVLAWRSVSADRRVALVLCSAAALCALLGAGLGQPFANPSSTASLALWALAIPAAGVFTAAVRRARVVRNVAAVAVLLAVLGGAWTLRGPVTEAWAAAERDDSLLGETAGALEPVSAEASAVDLRGALEWMRKDPRLRQDRAVLLACPIHNPYRTTRDLPALGLAACAGIDLYADDSSAVAEVESAAASRVTELVRLFLHPGDFDPALFARLEHEGARAVIALLREEDVALNPDLPPKLERLGYRPLAKFRGLSLYIGPHAAALRYLGEK